MRNKIPIQHFIKEKNERKAFKLEGFRSFLRYITVENGIIVRMRLHFNINTNDFYLFFNFSNGIRRFLV